MYRARRVPLLALGLAILASALPGCASAQKQDGRTWWWPFGKVSDTVPGITPPHQRIKQIRETANQAKSLAPADQERTALELTELYSRENDPLIRGEIIRGAGGLAAPGAMSLAREGLKDADADVRVLACGALGKHRNREASLALREALASDTDADVRLAAVKALGQTGDPEAVGALGAALDDRDPAMQYRAVGALRQVAPQDMGNDVDRWRQYVRGEPPAPPKPFSLTEQLRNMF